MPRRRKQDRPGHPDVYDSGRRLRHWFQREKDHRAKCRTDETKEERKKRLAKKGDRKRLRWNIGLSTWSEDVLAAIEADPTRDVRIELPDGTDWLRLPRSVFQGLQVESGDALKKRVERSIEHKTRDGSLVKSVAKFRYTGTVGISFGGSATCCGPEHSAPTTSDRTKSDRTD
jgi:hypothetical protein